MTKIVYKIVRAFEWQGAEQAGVFAGSADDRRDGFIHLSAAHQVPTTYSRYFADDHMALLVAVAADRLGPAVKWEASRGGEKFPHLYGPLPLTAVLSVEPIRKDAGGRPILPAEIT